MSPGPVSVPPPVLWAQKRSILYITIDSECKDQDYKFTDSTMYFKGIANNKTCEFTLNFLHKINPDKVTCKNLERTTEFIIPKAEEGPFWTTLTNDKKKLHFLKVDFNKWIVEKSEDEVKADNSDGQDNNFPPLFDNIAKMFNSGDKKPDMSDDLSSDSDDEELPGLDKVE